MIQAKNKGVGLMEYLFEAAQRAGVDVAYQAKMVGFLQDGFGRVTGVKVKTPAVLKTPPLGLLCWPQGGSRPMPRCGQGTSAPAGIRLRCGARGSTPAKPLRMALDIGAKPVGHWQGCHATPIDANAAPVGELHLTDRTNRLSYPYSIMVNSLGKRFVDEGEDTGAYTYVKMGRAILAQPGALAYQVFDQKTSIFWRSDTPPAPP